MEQEQPKTYRVYHLGTKPNEKRKTYLTDTNNRLLEYPFFGHLISPGKSSNGARLKLGDIGMVSDVSYRSRPVEFPQPLRVTSVIEVKEKSLDLVYQTPRARVYLLDSPKGKKVVATNEENIAFFHDVPTGLSDSDIEKFSEELFPLGSRVMFKPLSIGSHDPNSFTVKDLFFMPYQSLKIIYKMYKEQKTEHDDIIAGIERRFCVDKKNTEVALSRARRQGRMVHAQELSDILKQINRDEEIAKHAVGNPISIDELLYRAIPTRGVME